MVLELGLGSGLESELEMLRVRNAWVRRD